MLDGLRSLQCSDQIRTRISMMIDHIYMFQQSDILSTADELGYGDGESSPA